MRIDEVAVTETERLVLKALGGLQKGFGMELPENKGWQRSAAELRRKGFAKEEWGYWYLTDAGRSQLRSNEP